MPQLLIAQHLESPVKNFPTDNDGEFLRACVALPQHRPSARRRVAATLLTHRSPYSRYDRHGIAQSGSGVPMKKLKLDLHDDSSASDATKCAMPLAA
jgi:hypothetical protein